MVKDDICLGGGSKQIAFFWKKTAPKNTPIPLMSRIDPAKLLFSYATPLNF